MSRKLYVSSDISVDEAVAEVSDKDPMLALIWPWLLVHLDDWGRGSASPRRLKALMFPMNDGIGQDVVARALSAFAEVRLIVLYEVDGKEYLAVRPDKWWKYQTHIHTSKRESDGSSYPAPPEDAFAESRGDSRNRAENCASPSTLPPFHPLPTTHGKTPTSTETADGAPETPDLQGLVGDFHELCPSLPRILKLDENRRRRLRKAHKQLETDGLRAMFARVEASDLLAGREKSWKASFDWILKPENLAKILEGNYDNREGPGKRANVNRALAIAERLEREEAEHVTV